MKGRIGRTGRAGGVGPVGRVGWATVVTAAVCLVAVASGSACALEARWDSLAPGLDLGSFRDAWDTPAGDSTIRILRIDPARWEFRLLCQEELGLDGGKTAREFCRDHGLVAATNAGMFATDYRSHVGYLRHAGRFESGQWNQYRSVFAFGPKKAGIPPARILDVDPDAPGGPNGRNGMLASYGSLIQNLRLIARPGRNVWTASERSWSEAALGEDRSGRILMIFTRSPFAMHELNRILLALPINLVCAQHLEGGPEAQLYIHAGDFEREFSGSWETSFREDDQNARAWAIPNVLGIAPRGK